MTVSTSKSMATRAEDVTVFFSASGALTEFEVRDVDGTVRIVARKGDLTISDDSGATSTLAQGQETTREESDSQKEKKKKKRGGGVVPGATGGARLSRCHRHWYRDCCRGGSVGGLIESDNPASPAR